MQPFKLLIIALFVMGINAPLQAQILSWQYENIIDDNYQSGANPDMVKDAAGNLHVSYWNKEEDRLMYAFRQKSTGTWTTESIANSGSLGYASAITVDVSGNIHLAYIQDQSGRAYLRYATKAGGVWTTEAVMANDIGVYGADLSFPTYIHHSLDIMISAEGKPVILYFDGKVQTQVSCPAPIGLVYNNYELDMNLAIRTGTNTWQVSGFADIPDRKATGCLADGDRYGEFCRIVPSGGGKYQAVTNSFHNHDLLLFSSEANDLSNWEFSRIDSTNRQYIVEARHFRESFDYIDAAVTQDSILHITYGLSTFYGLLTSEPTRRTFYYAQVNLNKLGTPGYTPYIFRFLPNTVYRSYYSLAAHSKDSVYLTYYSVPDRKLVVAYSYNAGASWQNDTVMQVITNTSTKTLVHGDSLFVLTYEADKDYLILSSRKRTGTAWRHENATVSETRGNYMSSYMVRNGADDEAYIFFNENQVERFYYGERINQNWSFTPIDQAGKGGANVAFTQNTQGEPCAAYVFTRTAELRYAQRQNGTWFTGLVDGSSDPREVVLTTRGDSIHICYFDLSTGHLKYARAGAATGPWIISVLDSSSAIIGQRPNLFTDDAGTLHLSYTDAFKAILRYARKPIGGTWTKENVTAAGNYNPSFSSVNVTSQGDPQIAFRDASDNTIFLAEKISPTNWAINEVAIGDVTNLIGSPLKLIIDTENRPWVLYNYSSNHDDLRLVRQDGAGVWNPVSITNNTAEVSNVFDFHLLGDDFYILGKKNQEGYFGLGMLYAENGVRTALEAEFANQNLKVYPNPSSGNTTFEFSLNTADHISLTIYNLSGQMIYSVTEEEPLPAGNHQKNWNAENIPSGVYLCRLSGQKFTHYQKWVLIR
ncbi:MAG: T9SS type A sorting domain-containing protein [Bacteroidia bacterium]|nr:T9SS type A sorting domain-containing protein [Bacteroidia bacterium]